MSGGSSGPRGPTPEERRQQAGEYYKTWAQWNAESQAKYKSGLSSARARMAAGGMKPGTREWERAIGTIESAYEADVKSLREGQHYRTMQDYWREVGAKEAAGYDPSKYQATTDDDGNLTRPNITPEMEEARNRYNELINDEQAMLDWYASVFGAVGVPTGERKPVTARKRGGAENNPFAVPPEISNPWM